MFESLQGDDDPNALKTQVEADGRGIRQSWGWPPKPEDSLVRENHMTSRWLQLQMEGRSETEHGDKGMILEESSSMPYSLNIILKVPSAGLMKAFEVIKMKGIRGVVT